MTITLQAIESEHARISAMIEAFKEQSQATEYRIEEATFSLAAGERFAGPILNEDGTLSHYLILLPGEVEDVNWSAASEWALAQGGSLPTRREQSLLFTNLKHEFDGSYYWSCEKHETNSSYAWYQDFILGGQSGAPQRFELRARAVRRLPI